MRSAGPFPYAYDRLPYAATKAGVVAEEAGELVVQGILDDVLPVVTDPVAREMVERHAADREGFVRAQIEYVEGGT